MDSDLHPPSLPQASHPVHCQESVHDYAIGVSRGPHGQLTPGDWHQNPAMEAVPKIFSGTTVIGGGPQKTCSETEMCELVHWRVLSASRGNLECAERSRNATW